MIYFTGDIHGGIDIHKLGSRIAPQLKELTKSDYVIICGDFGLIWDDSAEEKFWRKWLEEKPFTILFIDGNHENFDKLNAFPVTEWNGGKIHRISDSIIHLMRGQVFTIDGKKIFTMGGASSHDKEYRKEGVSWWPEELPSYEEYEEARRNLKAHDQKVDIIVTHCAPFNVQHEIVLRKREFSYRSDSLTDFLSEIEWNTDFSAWFCGHYHVDLTSIVCPKLRVLYYDIVAY